MNYELLNSNQSTSLSIHSKTNIDLRAEDDLTPKMKKIFEKALIEEAQKGNKKALTRLIDSHEGYLNKAINKLRINSMKEEGYNCAVLGLIKAIKSFDLSKDVLLITYARSFIIREMRDFIEFECSIRKKRFIASKYDMDVEVSSIQTEKDSDYNEEYNNAIKYNENGFANVENQILFSDEAGSMLQNITETDKETIRRMLNGEKMSEICQEDNSFSWKLYRKNRRLLTKLREEVCE